MEQDAGSQLVARVARLETSMKRNRAIGVAAVALLFVAALSSGSPATPSSSPIVVRDASGRSATLTADGLTIKDAAGRERVFSGIGTGGPAVNLRDASGVKREGLFLAQDRPVLRQFDSSGNKRAEIGVDETQDGDLQLFDQAGHVRAALFRTNKGDPQLTLYGSDGKPRASFSTDDSSPYLTMLDASGTTRVHAGGYTDGTIGIDVRDAANTVLWKAP